MLVKDCFDLRKIRMVFGKIAAAFIVSAALIVLALFCFQPGWGNPLATVGQLYIFFVATPAAFIMSILGLVFDKRKPLAVITMVASGAWVAFLVVLICLQIFNLCWWIHLHHDPSWIARVFGIRLWHGRGKVTVFAHVLSEVVKLNIHILEELDRLEVPGTKTCDFGFESEISWQFRVNFVRLLIRKR